MRLFFTSFLALIVGNVCLVQTAAAQVPELNLDFWHVNSSTVEAIAEDSVNNAVYYAAGGSFKRLYPNRPYGVAFDTESGAPFTALKAPNDVVRVSVSDGDGGWYIGGEFTEIGGEERKYLAQIDASGNLTDWNPAPDGFVTALRVIDNSLFVGGEFTALSGKSRLKTASFDLASGEINDWVAHIAGPNVNDFEGDSSKTYIAGRFSKVNLAGLNGAAVDANTGATIGDYAFPDGAVFCSASDGNGGFFIGGAFDHVAGVPRQNIAHIEADGTLSSWNPGVDGDVNTIMLRDSLLFVGGDFTEIGGVIRRGAATLSPSTGEALSWNPRFAGEVLSFDSAEERIFVGGEYSAVGKWTSNGGLFDGTTGDLFFSEAIPNDIVWAAISDGNGGWFIGGQFTKIGNKQRSHIAHIDAQGEVSDWYPGDVSGTVRALELFDDRLYLSGDFTTIGEQSRTGLAALDAQTAEILPWDIFPSGTVNDLLVHNGVLFLAGTFGSVSGVSNPRLASIDLLTGELLPNSNSISGSITAIAAKENTLFLGGTFTSINGVSRNRIAALGISNGALLDWNPNANNSVSSMALLNDTLYVGGTFTTIADLPRNRLAALDINTGDATSWAPSNLASNTTHLAISGNTVYAGGNFLRNDGSVQVLAAALDATSGAVIDWDPNVIQGLFLRTLSVDGNNVYMGGSIASFGGDRQNSAASFDMATGELLTWNPMLGVNPVQVRAIHAQGQQVYLGGRFATIDGILRNSIVAVDINTAEETDWNVSLNGSGQIYAIAGADSVIYLGGSFSSVGGQSRLRLAQVDAFTGEMTPFDAGVSGGNVSALDLNDGVLYIAGSYSSIGGSSQGNAAAVDAQTAELLPWNPKIGFGRLNSIEREGNKVFLGASSGATWGGVSSESLAAVDAESGVAEPFNIGTNFNSDIFTLYLEDTTLYMGGSFAEINGLSQRWIAAVNTQSEEVLAFDPGFSGSVRTIRALNDNLWVSGDFSLVDGVDSRSLAVIDKTTGILSLETPNFSGSFLSGASIYELEIADNVAYVTGGFLSIGGTSNPYVAKIDALSGNLLDWDANIQDAGRTISISEGKAFVGGDFTRAGLRPMEGLIALSSATGQPNGFEVSVNGNIKALKVHNNMLYMGGDFSEIDGQPRTNLAAINLSTGELTDWAPITNSEVLKLEAFDDLVFATGEFSLVNGQPRAYIAAFDSESGALDPFDVSADGKVEDILVAEGILYIGGSYNEIQGQIRNYLSAFDAESTALLPFNPNPNDRLLGLTFANEALYVVGDFNEIGGEIISNVAAIDPQTGLALPFRIGSNGIFNIQAWKDQLIVSGSFFQVQGESRFRLASVDLVDGTLTEWNPLEEVFINAPSIFSLDAGPDRLYVVGSFDTIDGTVVGSPAVFGEFSESCSINAVCEPFSLILENDTLTVLSPEDIDGGSTSTCGGISLSVSPDSFGFDDLGTNMVTLTVTDTEGNIATCETTVTVIQAGTLTLQCPADVELSCSDSILPEFTGMAEAQSSCGISSLTYADVLNEEACSLHIMRTWTAIDLCGNTVNCEQLITQINDVAPSIDLPLQTSIGLTCSLLQPDELIAFLNGDLNGDDAESYAFFLEQLFDTYGLVPTGVSTSCGEATLMQVGFVAPSDFSCPVRAIVQAQWLAVDDCGNESDIVTTSIVVSDFSTPMIVGAPDVVLDCSSPITPEFTGFAYAFDDCEQDITPTYSDTPLGTDCSSSFIRTWSASDQCGNTATYEQFITLTDLGDDCLSPPTGLSATATNEGSVQLSWNPVPNSIACRVFGRLAGGSSSVAQATVTGNEPGSISVSHPTLQNGANIEWRVLCACSTAPLVTSPFSVWSSFVFDVTQSPVTEITTTNAKASTLELWPNPTDGTTNIFFLSATKGKMTLELFDLNGRNIDILFDNEAEAGTPYTVQVDGSGLSDGVYFCKLTAGNHVEVQRLVVSK